MEIVVFSLLRFFIPLLILRFPIFGVLASMYLDLQDFNFFTIKTQQDMNFYQSWDKFFDTYYLGIAFYTSFSWKDSLAKKLSVWAFLYRALGVFIFFLFPSRVLFLIFPNFFENLFLFYNFFKRFTHSEKLFVDKYINIIILTAIIIPKIIAEYYLHVLKSPSIFHLERVVRFPAFPTTLEDFVLYSLYIAPAVFVLIWRIIATKKAPYKKIQEG